MTSVINKIQATKKTIQSAKGTAAELWDNSNYDQLVELVGESGAKRAIQRKLDERGISDNDWNSYRDVRRKLHANPLRVSEELETASNLANAVVDC